MQTAQSRASRRRNEILVVFVILAVLLIPAILTLRSVQADVVNGSPHYSTPLGYTWSLTLFALPLGAILIALARNPMVRIPRKSFFLTLAVMLPISFLLDLAFALSFFTFPNGEATLGVKFWGLEFGPLSLRRKLPIEEFIFYILGLTVSLACYLWLREVWFGKYNQWGITESVDEGKDYRDQEILEHIHVFEVSVKPLLLAAGLALAALVYKRFGSHGYHEGYPLYFYYLLGFAFIPASFFFQTARRFINWRALSFSMLAMLLVSLFWEACLAIPFGWWGYEPKYMMGLFILQWFRSGFGSPGVPIEAVLVWIQVTFSMVVVYEIIRIVVLRRDASRRGLLLKDVLTKRSPVLEARTEKDREQVYRHRYEVYSKHLKKNIDTMDHARSRLIAPEDTWPETRLFYVQDDHNVRASARFITGSERICREEAFKIFELERFWAFPMSSMWFVQDLVASPGPWESLKIASMLLHTYRYARSNGGLFGFCLSDIERVPHYKRLGFRLFSTNFQSPVKGLNIPMVLVGPDVRYLEQIDSPFAAIAGEFQENRVAVEFCYNTFWRQEDAATATQIDRSRLALFDSLNAAAAGSEWTLENEELQDLYEKGCRLDLRPGDVLIESGSAGSALYILIEGLLVAYPNGECTIPSTWIRPGEVLGEMAYLLGDGVRTATVKAALPSKVAVIEPQTLQKWTETSPALSAKFFRRTAYALAKRLRARELA